MLAQSVQLRKVCVVEKTMFKHLLLVKSQHSVFFRVMEYPVSSMSTDVAAIKIVRWETILWLRRLYNGVQEVPDALCNFFLNTTNEMHNGHEYTKSLPRIIVSGLLRTQPNRLTQ